MTEGTVEHACRFEAEAPWQSLDQGLGACRAGSCDEAWSCDQSWGQGCRQPPRHRLRLGTRLRVLLSEHGAMLERALGKHKSTAVTIG